MNEKAQDEREVTDGWTTWLTCGSACDLQVVRPGSVQCNYTDAACPNACACPEGPYIGTQDFGARIRCERCGCPPLNPPVKRVHNHPPYEPICHERVFGGYLRGACLNDDGSDR